MRFVRMKNAILALSVVAIALATPSLTLAQRGGGGHGGGHGRGGGRGGGHVSGGSGQVRGGGRVNGGGPSANNGRGAVYGNPRGGSNAGTGRGQAYVRSGGRPGNFYGGPRYSYPGRYYSAYRGLNYGSNFRFGLGAGFGPYGYSYFPWYSGLGLDAGAFGGGRGYGYNNYGNNNYGGSYYSDGESIPVESQQATELIPAGEDYVPQFNNTTAELAAAASGGALLGITMDPQYPQAAVVREVTPGAPADRAGLRPGDMITSIDQRQVQSPNDVVNLIAAMQPGAQIAIQFVRPILRSEVQAAAPEQLVSPTVAAQPAAPSPPPTPAPSLNP